MKTPYAHQRHARQQNTSALLFDLWLNAPLSRAMLAQRNDLTKSTVTAICDELSALNLIREVGQQRNGAGRPPANLLGLNPQARGSIGLEISTNYVAVTLTDFCGQAVWRETVATSAAAPQAEILVRAEALLAVAIDEARQRGCWRAQADVGREVALVSARLASGEPSVLQNRPAEEALDHRIILQAAFAGDALAFDVVRSVFTLNHATGILNLNSIFDPELVLIEFDDVGRPAEFREWAEAVRRVPEINIQETVRRQMRARGLTPPAMGLATHGRDAFMLGAASLLVDAFLRTPPAAQI